MKKEHRDAIEKLGYEVAALCHERGISRDELIEELGSHDEHKAEDEDATD